MIKLTFMREITIRTSDDQVEFISTVLERLGAEVIQNNEVPVVEKEKKKDKKGKKKPSALNLFGTWKDLDIDPDNFRKQLWDRSHKF